MEFRKFSRTEILYIILIDDAESNIPFLYPNHVNIQALRTIQRLPQDLLQLANPIKFTEYYINSNEFIPYRVSFINRKDKEHLNEFLTNQKNLKIVFTEKAKDLGIQNKISNNVYSLTNFLDCSNLDQILVKTDNLLLKLTKNLEEILKALNIKSPFDNNFSVEIDKSILKEHSLFKPTIINHLRYNNMIGNFHYQEMSTQDDIIAEKESEAIKENSTFKRLNSFLKQLESFDELYKSLWDAGNPLKYKPDFQPLLLSLPFHNPDLKDFFGDKYNRETKRKLSLIQVEQTQNYVNDYILKSGENSEEVFKEIYTAAHFIREKLSYLDCICFLLSSFKFSPYVRLPLIGKSIYRELSFISPKNFNKFLSLKSQNKISDTILKIGANITKKILSEKFQKYLQNRNSQIVAVSDLPIEWITIENIPLCFTHDITRIPETTQANMLNSFVGNTMFDFSISSNIINETLVIIGTQDENFLKWHKLLFDMAKNQGFKVKICLTIEQFISTVKKYNPKFLIIDSHADIDSNSKQTYIQIGKERLTNKVIEENFISIPLVFISACGTAPVYGTFNPIANSFLQMGAKSVTSTFLPIDIDNSTIVYLTILGNLKITSEKGSFNNWLEYICYNIRSTFIHQTFLPFIEDKNLEKEYYSLIQKSLYFQERPRIYKSIIKTHQKVPKKDLKKHKSKIFEFLYYTNIGRGDLVHFDNFLRRFK